MTKKQETYKVFYQNLHTISRPYHCDAYCVDFGVKTFEKYEDVLEFAEQKLKKNIKCYVIDYSLDKKFGSLARHINQCFGSSYSSYCRDVCLAREMMSLINKYDVVAIF